MKSQIKVPIIGDITTNGYLLDLKTFQELIKNNVLFYQITLDGLAERHNRTRPLKGGGESYDRILYNLKQIKNSIKSNNFRIVIRCNIDESILLEIDEYIDQCAIIFENDSRFLFYPKLVIDMGGQKIGNIRDSLLETNMTLYNIICKMRERGLNVYDDFTDIFEKQGCFASRVGAYVVNYDGIIYKCNTIIGNYKDNEITKYNKLGSLASNDKDIVDQVKNAKWVIRSNINEKCRLCNVYPICKMTECCAKFHMKISQCIRDTDYLKTRLELMILYGYYSTI